MKTYTNLVNPFRGKGSHSHSYPEATISKGMVLSSTNTRAKGWDAYPRYHYGYTTLIDCIHIHLSETRIGNLGNVPFLPFTNKTQTVVPNGENKKAFFDSVSSHKNKKVPPACYYIHLGSYEVELTATSHAGFHCYTSPRKEKAGFYLYLTYTIHDCRLLVSELMVIRNIEMLGMKHINEWNLTVTFIFILNFWNLFPLLLVTKRDCHYI